MTKHAFAILGSLVFAGCGASPPPPPAKVTAAAASSSSSASPPAQARPPLDPALIGTATGGKPEVTDKVVKVSFPRDDVPVEVDGFAKMPPFMGLTSWAAFTPGEKPNVEAMVMGDLVLFEDEVNPVMSAALDHGLEVTALHNHFFFDKPRVYFMHISGEGLAAQLAQGVRAALDAEKAVRTRSASPGTSFGMPPVATPSKIDAAKLDALFAVKGASKDGMYKATMGRKATASCGCTVGKAMGVNTWAAFAGTDESAVVDGDFAVSEQELQPVLKALRGGGINIVAIHSHMTGEHPRILFLHYWGRGSTAALAATLKRALDLTAWDGRDGSTASAPLVSEPPQAAANLPGTSWSFDSETAGAPPSGFSFGRTGQGRPGKWVIRAEAGAPSGANVLAQIDADPTDNRFPVVFAGEPTLRDLELSVRCKSVSGAVDQACGLVFRLKDANNYYVTRANALEGNVRLYYVKDGRRQQIATFGGKVTAGAWHEYRVVARGDHFEVYWDGTKVIDHHDQTFGDAGKIGLWTKADSLTYFDDLSVKPLG